ncbi:MAG: hypothetical protein HKN22_01865, partial [Bacteroidia bacterium]|nr:hypothetical protein [Bacteroidia bacterium]
MRIFTLLIASLFLFLTNPSNTHAQNTEQCVSEIEFQEAAKQDPNLLKVREDLEKETAEWIANKSSQRGGGQVYKIPVVFHVIHTCGGENISKAQILNQLETLNEDFSRTNSDASQTPLQFANVAADTEIEFVLAQLDPQGNCTDGINRIYSNLSHSPDPRNSVKSTIYWPRSKYLNIWVVGSIINTSGSGGIILGYAQFPGGSGTTDGIVIRADYTGSIGT